MKALTSALLAKAAVGTLAEIKAAAERFERGDINLFETLDEITAAVEGYRAASRDATRRSRRHRDAA